MQPISLQKKGAGSNFNNRRIIPSKDGNYIPPPGCVMHEKAERADLAGPSDSACDVLDYMVRI